MARASSKVDRSDAAKLVINDLELVERNGLGR
jgi:hypothetical protein